MGGVVHLFILRFETGDVYPAYSSLRSDPLGARALYDSLQNFDDIEVRRNYHLLHSVKMEDDTTFFYLGTSPPEYDSVSEEMVKVFDRLTQSGGRLVVSYLPAHKKIEKNKCTKEGIDSDDKASLAIDDEAQNSQQDKHDLTDTPPSNESESQKSNDFESSKKPLKKKFVSMKEHWGIGFDYNENIPTKDDKYPALQATTGRPELPPAISWHTNLYFEMISLLACL